MKRGILGRMPGCCDALLFNGRYHRDNVGRIMLTVPHWQRFAVFDNTGSSFQYHDGGAGLCSRDGEAEGGYAFGLYIVKEHRFAAGNCGVTTLEVREYSDGAKLQVMHLVVELVEGLVNGYLETAVMQSLYGVATLDTAILVDLKSFQGMQVAGCYLAAAGRAHDIRFHHADHGRVQPVQERIVVIMCDFLCHAMSQDSGGATG